MHHWSWWQWALAWLGSTLGAILVFFVIAAIVVFVVVRALMSGGKA